MSRVKLVWFVPADALDVFTDWKSVYVDYSGTLQRAQIDNQ